MTLLALPGRHHALHVLGVLVRDGEKRFGELVTATAHHDVEVNRAIAYLRDEHLVRSRTMAAQGKRIILAYSATARGEAAWQAFEAYRQAIRERAHVLGQKEIEAVDGVLEA